MLTFFSLFKNSRPFSEAEDLSIKCILKQAQSICPGIGEILQDLRIDNIQFYWADAMLESDCILGAWSPLTPDSIYIRPYPILASANKPQRTEVAALESISYLLISDMFITVLHELVHMRQYRRSKCRYIFGNLISKLGLDKLPGCSSLGIESEAESLSSTSEVYNFAVDLDRIISSAVCLLRTAIYGSGVAPEDAVNALDIQLFKGDRPYEGIAREVVQLALGVRKNEKK